MERRDRTTRRPPLGKRSPREEVVEILVEALWTLICPILTTTDHNHW